MIVITTPSGRIGRSVVETLLATDPTLWAIMSEELDAFEQLLLGRDVSQSFAQGYVDMVGANNEAMDNVAERTVDSRTTTSFRQWVRESLEPALRG